MGQAGRPGEELKTIMVISIYDVADVVRMDMAVGPVPEQSKPMIVPATRMPRGPIGG